MHDSQSTSVTMAGISRVTDVDVVSMVKLCAVRHSSSTTSEPFARVMCVSAQSSEASVKATSCGCIGVRSFSHVLEVSEVMALSF